MTAGIQHALEKVEAAISRQGLFMHDAHRIKQASSWKAHGTTASAHPVRLKDFVEFRPTRGQSAGTPGLLIQGLPPPTDFFQKTNPSSSLDKKST